MVKRQDGWVAAMVRGSLEGMGEVTEASWSQEGEVSLLPGRSVGVVNECFPASGR